PDGNIQTGVEYAPPTNQIEEVLVEIWQEVLNVKQIGIHDNFVDLGGHSLKAAMLKSRILKELEVEVSLEAVFDYPRVTELAGFISELEKKSFVAIEKIEEEEFYPVSSAQKRLYAIQQLESVGCAYNLPVVLEVEGPLDVQRLQKAIEALVQRHEALRTSFHLIEGELVQKVHSQMQAQFTHMEAVDENEGEVLIAGFIRPFHLSNAPLFRAGLIRLKKERHILVIDMHHIIADGISKDIFNRELVQLYRDDNLSKLSIQYKDYATWHNNMKQTSKWKEQEEYWLNQFSGELPILELPTDYPRPSVQQFDGRKLLFELTPEMTKQLKQIATNQGATLYMLLLASYQVLLSKYGNQEDIIVGTPVAGRFHPDLESIFGMFVNTLAIRSYPQAEQTFEQFLSQVKERVFKAYQHGDYSLDELVDKLSIRRDLSRNSLFDTMFVLQNMDMNEIEIPGLTFKTFEIEWKKSVFDMTWEAVEKNGLQFTIEYNTSLFTQLSIERMFGRFKQILQQVVTNPTIQLANIEWVTEEEQQVLLEEFNQTETEYTREKTIHEQFEEQVEKHPDRLAVVFEEATATYRELNERANQVARVLREKGVEREAFVGIMVDRSIEAIVGVL
ncbi:condensation domain-containing protein, partial [Bacillus sp. C1]